MDGNSASHSIYPIFAISPSSPTYSVPKLYSHNEDGEAQMICSFNGSENCECVLVNICLIGNF